MEVKVVAKEGKDGSEGHQVFCAIRDQMQN